MKRKLLSVVMVLLLVMNFGMMVSAEASDPQVDTSAQYLDSYYVKGTSILTLTSAIASTECFVGCVSINVKTVYNVKSLNGTVSITGSNSGTNYTSANLSAGSDRESIAMTSTHSAINNQTGAACCFTTHVLFW